MITSGQSNSTKRPHCCGTGRDGAVMFVRLRLCAPHLIHASLDSLQSTSQTASRLHQPFLANVRYAVARPSVCLSSVTLMHPTQAVVIFGNCSTVFGTLAILGHWQKILWRSSQGNPSVGGVKPKRGSKI